MNQVQKTTHKKGKIKKNSLFNNQFFNQLKPEFQQNKIDP